MNTDSYFMSEDLGQGNYAAAFPTVEPYSLGSFWPGITDFWRQGEVPNSCWESAEGFHEAGVGHTGIDAPGTI